MYYLVQQRTTTNIVYNLCILRLASAHLYKVLLRLDIVEQEGPNKSDQLAQNCVNINQRAVRLRRGTTGVLCRVDCTAIERKVRLKDCPRKGEEIPCIIGSIDLQALISAHRICRLLSCCHCSEIVQFPILFNL